MLNQSMRRLRFGGAVLLIAIVPTACGCSGAAVGMYETVWLNGVKYATRDGGVELCMDIVRPKGVTSPAPGVLWLHGGGWAYGNRSLMRPLAETMASLGYVSATASYRLVNRNCCFPKPVEDAADAVRFLRRHAAEYGLDGSRIAIGGESAGGHLALLVGLCHDAAVVGENPSDEERSDVCAVVNIYGPTMLAPLKEGSGLHVAPLVQNLVGGTVKDVPEKYQAASPIAWVRRESPPILTLHGDWDTIVPFEQATLLRDACAKCGARNDFGRVRCAGHGWIANSGGSVYRSTLPLLTQFLAQVFSSAPTAGGTDAGN